VAHPRTVAQKQHACGDPAGQGALFPHEPGDMANSTLQPTRNQKRRRLTKP
jgi:hypothetical protein